MLHRFTYLCAGPFPHHQDADPILDAIDPQGHIKYRLYRDSTVEYNGYPYVKDLRVLGRDLRRTVLLDNALDSFRANPNNGEW